MAAKRDYYEVLGVSKTSSQHEVKQQYRKLALKFHPDRNQYSDAEEHFKEISEAYAVISDPRKKQVYDQYGQYSDAEEHFKEISEAYAVISDPRKKQVYDQYGHAGTNGRYSGQDIFSGVQGGGFNSNDAWGWRNKGGALYSLGKYDESIDNLS